MLPHNADLERRVTTVRREAGDALGFGALAGPAVVDQVVKPAFGERASACAGRPRLLTNAFALVSSFVYIFPLSGRDVTRGCIW
jgi:hypothetical protein